MKLWIVSAVVAALGAAMPAQAQDCVPTVAFTRSSTGFGGFPQTTTVRQRCSAEDPNDKDYILLMTLVRDLQAQNARLTQMVETLNKLVTANEAFRDTFQREVTERQTTMRNDVVTQLTALPGRVATDEAVVNTLASSVATRLANDPAFRERLREDEAQ